MSTDYAPITNAFHSFLTPVLIVVVTIAVIALILALIKKSLLNKKLKSIAQEAAEISPTEFFKLKNKASDYAGVYVLYNQTKDLYYVGQSKNVFKRVNNHFTGKGNGDVYADYKYGDQFTIRMISLEGSGFTSLDRLERHYIEYFNAFTRGYNKNRGNRG